MIDLTDTFTSTGAKFFAHEEAMKNLRNGKGQPITTHIMLTDVCNHTCAFCSVQARAGDSLVFDDVIAYLDILLEFDLKSVILSGGGNPILYKCKKTGKNFNDVVNAAYARGLDIGLITNGMKLYTSDARVKIRPNKIIYRKSWTTVKPETLDKLAWIRISMSGLDHEEKEVYVPDIDIEKTTLGFSYVAHDIYNEPEDPYHGKVSTKLDLISDRGREPSLYFEERIEELTETISSYARKHKPRYIRLLPNCLEPELIACRCKQLEVMARKINFDMNQEVAFVQYKPPRAPKACYLGYIHPVLNCDGYIYPCDSCVLNKDANHSFSNPWRVCHWRDVAQIYQKPVRSLIDDPAKLCPGCVFTRSNEILGTVVNGSADLTPPSEPPFHMNFV